VRADTDGWFASSERDRQASALLAGGDLVEQAVFYLHLSVEKALKAVICERSGSEKLPFIHNLIALADRAEVRPPAHMTLFLARLSPHGVGTRYAVTDPTVLAMYTPQLYEGLAPGVEEIVEWLKQQAG
jgi:HEPN domain-containing protein